MLDMGIPSRMANAVHRLFGGLNDKKNEVIEAVLADDQRVPLATDGVQTGEGALHHAADAASRECYRICHRVQTADAILIAIGMVCRRRGVAVPRGATVSEIIARAVDKAWWYRHIRTEFKRRFEHIAIQLGVTGVRTDPYISRESAIMQEQRNRDNQKLLEACQAINEKGDVYTLAELAGTGVSSKAIRRGELMLRIRGFEEVAGVLRHVGMFWTITCPSKFHSVGGTNEKYNNATPRQAQAYLCKIWARMRSALHRAGIKPYGFRIAEPHTDGCPHWHMLLFVAPEQAVQMQEIIEAYALEEDGDEAGAKKNRVKLVQIEANKGTAAGYIVKYVCKNIDGFGVGDHKAFENGSTYNIATDFFGNVELTASQRVTYWAQVWGIRQFQQIGGVPIGVWREVRRIAADTVQHAPEAVREAYQACQKIESKDPAVAQQADFARFIWAMGGPTCGRQAAIKLACKEVSITGKYVTYDAKKPVGVYLAAQPHAVYESVRYQWTITGPGDRAGVAFAVPRTGVNKCTRPAWTKKNPIENPIGKNKNFVPAFYVSRNFDPATGAPCAKVDQVALYQRHKKRPAGAPSAHLLHLQRKYKKDQQ
jgi:hypothetical protein